MRPVSFVVSVATDPTNPDLFGPFPSRDAAWKFAHQVRRDRRRDAGMPAVDVRPVRPGRMSAFRH